MFRTERATPIEWDVELRHHMLTQKLVVTIFENLLCSDLRFFFYKQKSSCLLSFRVKMFIYPLPPLKKIAFTTWRPVGRSALNHEISLWIHRPLCLKVQYIFLESRCSQLFFRWCRPRSRSNCWSLYKCCPLNIFIPFWFKVDKIGTEMSRESRYYWLVVFVQMFSTQYLLIPLL